MKDAIAYLSLLANPADAISFTRVINSPRRGIGRQTESRILSHTNTTGEDVWDVMSRPESVPGLGAAAVKAVHRFAAVMAGLRERAEGDSVAELLESVLHDTGYFDSLEAERTLEAEGRMENLQELVGVAGEFDVNRKVEGEEREDTPLEEFLAQIRLFTEQDGIRDHGEPDHAHEPPQREGPRVRRRVHHRLRGGRLPARALGRGGQSRGGAPPRIRRRHPREAAPLHDLRPPPEPSRLVRLEPSFPLPARGSRRAGRPQGDGGPDRLAGRARGRSAGATPSSASAGRGRSGRRSAPSRSLQRRSSGSATTSSTRASARASSPRSSRAASWSCASRPKAASAS